MVQPIKQSSTISLSLTPHINSPSIQYDFTATFTTLIKVVICILLTAAIPRYFQHQSQSTPVKYEVYLLTPEFSNDLVSGLIVQLMRSETSFLGLSPRILFGIEKKLSTREEWSCLKLEPSQWPERIEFLSAQ